ncbi:hypothetical protein SCLCIDRAFT_28112 [Scleroderma citrinum Foug A]|uniref:Uncharacterized protein n=1 Tax=Scleroderma citrinum Foug A TaxID=1036808 RepID=A0A0C3DQ49_9AGAM|nr:hypothetical protein SCLCIDRAFT_28112 [Scleroderma citrinum Foug A]
MSTKITPYQLSIALQYIGIQFRWFSCAVQQSARWSTQPPQNWFQQVRVEVHVLEQILAISNSIGTIMQVPHMANRILSFVTSRNIMAEALFLELRDINVFKVQSAEAQIRNTGMMPNMWWEDGKCLPDQYVSRSIVEIVSEAKIFFPTVEDSTEALAIQHAANADRVHPAYVKLLQPDPGGIEGGNREVKEQLMETWDQSVCRPANEKDLC